MQTNSVVYGIHKYEENMGNHVILSKQKITSAYPLQISLVFTLTIVSDFYFFNEKLSTSGIVGLFVIFLGVFILYKS